VRFGYVFLLSGTAILASPAIAAEQLQIGPAPTWVIPQTSPSTPAKATDAPLVVLLKDDQIRLQPGKTIRYGELAFKIQKPEGLAAGNLSLTWDPATDLITVNKVEIHRGDQVFDVLKSGQKFTTLRRETNLELAVLDGMLTANLQPEDLREGDIIDVATTTEHVDPVLKDHVEADFGEWNGVPITLAHSRLEWPIGMALNVRESGGLQTVAPVRQGGNNVIDISSRNVEPLVPPKAAPSRFSIGRLGEATNFRSWSDAAELMAPLYHAAAVIPESGPLHDEVEKIRAATSDPKARAEKALELVQNRVRYLALLMGQGGYTPAKAEDTWSRRFGDCKAKTALLLAILHSLGIESDPVLVRSNNGDAVADRLPTLGIFDHVLVRAKVGSKIYWLDGTRTGDLSLDGIEVPDFTWGLPLVTKSALVSISPPPLDHPQSDLQVTIDASKGVRASSPFAVNQILRGDGAIMLNKLVAGLSDNQRLEFFNTYWKKIYDFITPGPTSTTFDDKSKTYRLSMTGEAKLDWNTRYFHLPNSTLGYTPDFDRPAGPLHDAPLAVSYPYYVHYLTIIRFPPGFFGVREKGTTPTTRETLAGIEYRMAATTVSDKAADTLTVESSERSIAPEIPYKDGLAAAARLRQLADEDVAIPLPATYRPTPADLSSIVSEQPTSASGFGERANAMMTSGRTDDAIADLTKGIELEPKNAMLLAQRAFAHLVKGDRGAAEKDAAAAVAAEPTNPAASYVRGLLAQTKGDYKTAAEILSAAVHSNPENFSALHSLATVNHELGKDDEALEESSKALELQPALMDLRVLRANIFYVRGDRSAVASEAKLLVQQNPQSDWAYVAAGKIYARLGMKEEAFKAYDRAIAIKPQAYIYINRAQSRPYSDRAGRISDLDTALKLDPSNPDALAEEAQLIADSGDFKRAADLYDRASLDAPDNSYLRISHAAMLYKAGRTAEAQRVFAAFRKNAMTATDFNNLCWGKATAGILLESALADCREALRREPGAPNFLDSLGLVLLRLGKLDESIDAYARALAKRDASDSYMGRALAYVRNGDKTHADADLTRAIKLDPDVQDRFAHYGLKF